MPFKNESKDMTVNSLRISWCSSFSYLLCLLFNEELVTDRVIAGAHSGSVLDL